MIGPPAPRAHDVRYWLASHRGPMLAAALFVAMFAVFVTEHPAGFSADILNTAANKGVLLALIAIAQTIPVLTAGLDLSVGSVFVMTNCVASTVMTGTPLHAGLGVAIVLAVGVACGALNGVVVVFGRLQPIIATLATGAIYHGIALWLRPAPGGEVNEDFADAMTGSIRDAVPVSIVVLVAAIVVIWIPYRRSVMGRAAYAVGSSQQAAYMSGVPVARAKFVAYVLAGLFSAMAGVLLTGLTYSGEANALLAGSYTLNSIAAVVVGGTSLYGGSGSAIGSIFGAFVLRTIGDLLFVFDMDPLSQPLFLGIVLLISVSLGSFRLLKIKKRVDLYR
ncbi:MAG TPA: ABC transporter permease [Kofleriaceae bacterium]